MNKKLTQIIFVFLMLAAGISQAQVDTFTVTKTTDFDPFLYQDNPEDTAIAGTLQWAVRKANDAIVPCVIVFNISGNGQHTINLIYQLPYLNNEIIIDATTQNGYTPGNPAIIIDGANAIPICFHLAIDNCSIKGCYIQNFTSKGISVYNVNGFLIENNVINRIIIPPPSPLKPCVIPASGIALFNCMNGIIRTNIIGTDAT
ncbi:MAG: hypothetical protein HY958_05320, partial [Bacteroidia bacterium]|nr:hypothetical protein [Bacteroidia bacterium]